MTATLATKQVVLGYQIAISKPIDCNFRLGECVLLAGSNGSGKSTLLKTLAGIISPISGEIELNGKILRDFKPSELAKELAICLTVRAASPQMKVRDIVELARSPYSNWLGRLSQNDHAEVNLAMERLEILPLQNEPFAQLSDGQKQKVLLSRAFAQQTPILLLDEPLSFLDRKNHKQFINMISSLCHESGKLVIFSAHELSLAVEIADRVIVLNELGEIREVSGENFHVQQIENFM